MSSEAHNHKHTKLCFVTVGATAAFKSLLHSVLNSAFLSTLRELGYTHLLIQYGLDGRQIFDDFIHLVGQQDTSGGCEIQVDGFDFKKSGLGPEMRLAKENKLENRFMGVIISHAGMLIGREMEAGFAG